ncbi:MULTISPECIES: cupin domain-containing protein [unclassified Pseudomonas]|uniref:cupin domain-containing protein n=1 Tax=unclassified Pseudomonas TaxID=196821 RepID=UPI0035C16E51
MKTSHLSLSLLMAMGLVTVNAPAWAHDEALVLSQVKVLQEQRPDIAPDKKIVMLTVNYEPGQSSPAHAHPGAVMAYVLEGAVVSQLNDEAEHTFKAGEYWYEAPGTQHKVSRNASKTQPAKLLVWSLVAQDSPVTTPLK